MPVGSQIKIIRSRRKTLALSISADSTIVVKVPWFTPQYFINQFLNKHDAWIQSQIAKLQARTTSGKKKYVNGEPFLYMGMNLLLQIGNYQEISVVKNKLLFPNFMLFRAQKQLTAWYKKQARELITRQVDYYGAKMKTTYTGITFSDTKSQWGSCSKDNKLQFSWRLIMTPWLTLNYVVIHELAHTLEKNHGRPFWDIVRRYNPSYLIQRKWLKKNGDALSI